MASSVNIKKGQGYVLGTGATATGISPVAGSSTSGVMNPSTSGSSGSAANGPATSYQEFSVRVPKLDRPRSVMRFNGALNVDMGKWTTLKMVRDDHTNRAKTELKFDEPDMPKFGAGSEYGREAREELRRRKYGGNRKKVALDDQPWILKTTSAVDKITRRYKGLREGTISSNASYFVFTQATDGQFEVFPVSQWYNFTPVITYKALSAEEAEEEFGRRDKIMNYFNVMFRKRMRGDEGDGGEKDEEKTSKKKGGGSGGLKVSEMEDWDDVNEMESEDDEDEESTNKEDKKKKKKNAGGKKKKKKGSDSEANEDSDDGDGEGRELDYISDTSASSADEETKEGDKLDLPGVEQEPGLSNLLESDSSDEEDKDKKDKEGEEKAEDEEKPNKSNKSGNGNKKTGNKKSNKKKTNESQAAAITENLSDGDSDDSEGDAMNESDEGPKPGTSQSSQGRDSSKTVAASSSSNIDKERESTPEGEDGVDGRKRKAGQAIASANAPTSAKKAKMEVNPILLQTAASEGITEEAVRRYLHRKPMTVTELLQKFKSKKTKVSSEDMVTIIASILKKINPTKRNQNGKMYLSLKA